MAFILLLIGAGTYLYAYVYGRSLYLDEANLGLVLETVSFSDLFLPLPFEQYAPPLFLAVAKGALSITGHHEWGLRLIPLLAALGSLAGMAFLLSKLNWSWGARCFVFGWMAFSPHLIRYASECKQYSWDVLIIILLISLALRFREHPPARWLWVGTGLLFVLMPWASMPAVFLLGIWGGLEILENLRTRNVQKLIGWASVSFLSLLSFLVYYNLVIGSNLGSSLLLDYHEPYFMPWRLDQPGNLTRAFSILNDLWALSFGHTAISLFLGLGLAILGFLTLMGRNRFLAYLLSGPIGLAVLASMTGQFTLIPRVNLFMAPLFLLLAGAGMHWIINRWSSRFLPAILTVIWILCISAFLGKVTKLWQEPEIEDLHQVIQKLADLDDHSPWYVHWEATPAFRYYTEFHTDRSRYKSNKAIILPWMEDHQVQALAEQDSAFWFVFSHLVSDQARMVQQQLHASLEGPFTPIDSIQAHCALAIKYEKQVKIEN